MGMRFAGTANNQAFEALFKLTKKLMAISKRSVAELAGKATMEQTICIMVLALSIGNNDNRMLLEVLKKFPRGWPLMTSPIFCHPYYTE